MKLPSAEQSNYGKDMYSIGYGRGYRQRMHDDRKRRLLKNKSLILRFNAYVDYLEDVMASNRKH